MYCPLLHYFLVVVNPCNYISVYLSHCLLLFASFYCLLFLDKFFPRISAQFAVLYHSCMFTALLPMILIWKSSRSVYCVCACAHTHMHTCFYSMGFCIVNTVWAESQYLLNSGLNSATLSLIVINWYNYNVNTIQLLFV